MNDRLLFLPSIDLAGVRLNVDGEAYVDILSTDILISKTALVSKLVVVGGALAGKPWEIMKSLYKTTDNIDIFFSINGISNPINVKKGDVLIVPEYQELSRFINKNDENLSIKELEKRTSQIDKKRLEFLGVNKLSNPNNNVLKQQVVETQNSFVLGATSSTQISAQQIYKKRVLNKNL
jgi:uncharacterized membrane protein